MSEIMEGTNRFYIGDEKNPDAQLIYEENDSIMVIKSTVVTEEKREQGLGRELVDYAVNHARKNKWKINPVCSFAAHVMKNTPEYHVVLAE